MEQTANYHLSQWKGEERILVEDLNTGNAKVDAALISLRTMSPLVVRTVR